MVVMLCKQCKSIMKQYDDVWICSECERTREEVEENGKSIDTRRGSTEGIRSS